MKVRKRKRKYIPQREKLAAALSWRLPPPLQTVLTEAKAPADEVIGLFEWHHADFHALGGQDRWFNLTPILKAEHRARTPADIKTIAKVKRLSAAHEDFRRRVLAVKKQPHKPKGWPTRAMLARPFPKHEG